MTPLSAPVTTCERLFSSHFGLRFRFVPSPQVSPPIKIGRGVFAVKYDAARQHVYASSGVAGNIAVIRATPGATPYNVREAVFTKAGTRTMAFDPNSGAIFTAAPDGRYNPRMPVNEDLSGAPTAGAVVALRRNGSGGGPGAALLARMQELLASRTERPLVDPVRGQSSTGAALGAWRFANAPPLLIDSLCCHAGGVSFFPNDPYPNTMEVMSFRLP